MSLSYFVGLNFSKSQSDNSRKWSVITDRSRRRSMFETMKSGNDSLHCLSNIWQHFIRFLWKELTRPICDSASWWPTNLSGEFYKFLMPFEYTRALETVTKSLNKHPVEGIMWPSTGPALLGDQTGMCPRAPSQTVKGWLLGEGAAWPPTEFSGHGDSDWTEVRQRQNIF